MEIMVGLFNYNSKKIVNAVDCHPSTIGYEILKRPQIHSDNQRTKVGKYNTFMVDEPRKMTTKNSI